jgi:hypothetical protein
MNVLVQVKGHDLSTMQHTVNYACRMSKYSVTTIMNSLCELKDIYSQCRGHSCLANVTQQLAVHKY